MHTQIGLPYTNITIRALVAQSAAKVSIVNIRLNACCQAVRHVAATVESANTADSTEAALLRPTLVLNFLHTSWFLLHMCSYTALCGCIVVQGQETQKRFLVYERVFHGRERQPQQAGVIALERQRWLRVGHLVEARHVQHLQRLRVAAQPGLEHGVALAHPPELGVAGTQRILRRKVSQCVSSQESTQLLQMQKKEVINAIELSTSSSAQHISHDTMAIVQLPSTS